MLLSAVSVLVVAQSSSEIPEGLMNNPVYYRTYTCYRCLPEDELSGSKHEHLEYIVKIKIKLNSAEVHFVGLHYVTVYKARRKEHKSVVPLCAFHEGVLDEWRNTSTYSIRD
jgi:hypothetical protein